MSEHTEKLVDSLINKDYMAARESLKNAVEETITANIETEKEKIRNAFKDQ